jgi:hypothetical protein
MSNRGPEAPRCTILASLPWAIAPSATPTERIGSGEGDNRPRDPFTIPRCSPSGALFDRSVEAEGLCSDEG